MGHRTMEQSTSTSEIDARTLSRIRWTARHLARTCYLPGMDADDIAQDLVLDLWRRRHAFDPAKASFATFADRIITNRAASLTSPTARSRAERRQIWLDRPIEDDGANTLAEKLADPSGLSEFDQALALDVRRFFAGLTPALQRCCEIWLTPNIGQAATRAGLQRSSIHEGVQRLRRLAELAGLKEYIAPPRQNYAPAGKCKL